MNGEPCPAHQRQSFAQEIVLVNELLAQGDEAHALHHCVSAIGLEPHLPHWQAPLQQLLAGPGVVDRLRGDVFFGAQAALAFHQHARGDLGPAMDLVAQIHEAVPHLGFHRWLFAWAEQAQTQGLAIDPEPLIRALSVGASFGIGRLRLLPGERAAAEELLPVARLALDVVPGDGRVALLASSVLRRAGRWQEAVEAAERALPTQVRPEQAATVRGLALRGLGAFDAALEVFESALSASGDTTYLMEKIRVLADAGRWSDALETWETYTSSRPPDEESLLEHQAIQRAAQAEAPPPEEPPLDIVRRRSLGHGRLWSMHDASANALRQIAGDPRWRAKGPVAAGETVRSSNVTLKVSGAEGPSNRLCQALMFAGRPDPRLARYSSSTDGDVGLDREPTQYTLWRRDGDVIVQALPPPPDPVSDWVERLALHEPDGTASEARFETAADFLDMWSVAADAPLPDAAARDWMAATIYPRMPVFRVCAGPEWVCRWHAAALIGLARSEPGWTGTSRREALASLLNGPVDWPLAAAIRVAAEIALREPDTTREIRQTLIDLSYRLEREDNQGVVAALLGALEMIPYVPTEDRDRLRKALELEKEGGDDSNAHDGAPDPAEDPEERPPADRRPWWKFW